MEDLDEQGDDTRIDCIWAPLLLATGAVAGEKTPDARPGDPMASCAQMMPG